MSETQETRDLTVGSISSGGARSSTPIVEDQAYLLVFERDSSRMFELPRNGEILIGQSESVELSLADAAVSRNHARITMTAGQAKIADLGSHNGTRVNSERIAGTRLLTTGDVVGICSVNLTFHTHAGRKTARTALDLQPFRERFEEELERALRYRRPLSLIAIELMLEAPDRLQIANLIFQGLRLIDIVGWYGADQVLVLMPEVAHEAALATATKVVEGLAEVAASARVGLATYPVNGCDVDTLVSSARTAAGAAEAQKVVAATSTFTRLDIGQGMVAVVADPAMTRLYTLIRRLAQSDLPVLVDGETGTGKELAAHALHHWSARKEKPLIAVNCAALPENLVESELFGHDKGAFSGALTAKIGMLEAGSGGTIFFDEIGELPLAIQAKLLRVLETKRIARLGEVREREVDIRIVAATNRDLTSEVKAGHFRQDLFFRLSGANVWLPPLRHRRQELPILAQTFLDQACERTRQPSRVLSDAALEMMASYAWPGNIRELRNVMEYIVAAFADPMVEPWHLQDRLGPGDSGEDTERIILPSRDALKRPAGAGAPASTPRTFRPIEEEIRELEKTRMMAALDEAQGNKTRAAELIGMPLRTFATKFKLYDLGNNGQESA